nr:MAG: ORF3 [Torque teno polar bear virus 27]
MKSPRKSQRSICISESPTCSTKSGISGIWEDDDSSQDWFESPQPPTPPMLRGGESLYSIITGAEPINYITKYTSEWLSFYVRARSGTERPEVSQVSEARGRVPEA